MSAPGQQQGGRGSRVSLLRWLPAIAWMAAIFALSSISGLRVSDVDEVDRPIRALAHLASYAFLGALVLYALSGRARPTLRIVLLAFAITLLYGLSDEIHQSTVPNRSGRVEDLVIDALGAIIGLVIASALLARWAMRSSQHSTRRGGLR